MSSSLANNSIFHCWRYYYITSTSRSASYSFVDFTSPYISKGTSKEVSQSLVKSIKNKSSPIWCWNSSLAQIFTNHLLKDSLVNVQILSIDFFITAIVRYRSLWLTIIFHSQSTESFNQNASENQSINFLLP